MRGQRKAAAGTAALPKKDLRLGVRAALERRPIVIAGGAGIGAARLLLGLLGLAAQGRLVFAFCDLAREHDVAEASFNRIKFRGGDNVFLARGKNARNFLLRVADTLRRGRMRGESLRDGAGTALFVGLDRS